MDNSESDSDDLLNDLLANVTEDNDGKEQGNDVDKPRTLKELNFNFLDKSEDNSIANKVGSNKSNSEVYDNKIDSSDDEDNRYFEEQKYSSSGHEIKNLLKGQNIEKPTYSTSSFDNNSIKAINTIKRSNTLSVPISAASANKDVYADPFFGIRIVTPLVSSVELTERMTGRTAVTVSKVKHHITSNDLQDDWVLGGVIINISNTKKSQKGSSYCIWKISDLSDNMNAISVFLFSNAHKAFWKTTAGTVIGILNPNVLNAKEGYDEASLSVDNAQKIMILGKSKDMGKCKSIKKNGDPCSSIVNISKCEYCVYHVKQEYNKCSRRAELQTTTDLRKFGLDLKSNKTNNKPRAALPGMQPFVPVFAKRNDKLHAKDQERLALLSGKQNMPEKSSQSKVNTEVPRKGHMVELTARQAKKDMERLNRLRGCTTGSQIITPVPSTSKSSSPSHCAEKKQSDSSSTSKVEKSFLTFSPTLGKGLAGLSSCPQLGKGSCNNLIDFSEPITKTHIDKARSNAIKWIQQNGQLKPKDPNKIRLSKEERVEKNAKRLRETEEEQKSAKKAKNFSDKFKELLEKSSSHSDLIEISQEAEKEKYFNKLEMKERLEEKMLTTYKVNCKAVKCILCKYTAFSASDLCKEQKHPIRVMDAVKRFFKCSDCGNRTVSLDKIPSHSCKKCNSSRWARAPMMDEKKTKIPRENLSIRGGEEKFIGSAISDANLNLLVPDND